jgi:hypothetical protein
MVTKDTIINSLESIEATGLELAEGYIGANNPYKGIKSKVFEENGYIYIPLSWDFYVRIKGKLG